MDHIVDDVTSCFSNVLYVKPGNKNQTLGHQLQVKFEFMVDYASMILYLIPISTCLNPKVGQNL